MNHKSYDIEDFLFIIAEEAKLKAFMQIEIIELKREIKRLNEQLNIKEEDLGGDS